MVTELIKAMELYRERHGEPLRVIQLDREHHRELVRELKSRGLLTHENIAGEEELFNGARIEVI